MIWKILDSLKYLILTDLGRIILACALLLIGGALIRWTRAQKIGNWIFVIGLTLLLAEILLMIIVAIAKNL